MANEQGLVAAKPNFLEELARKLFKRNCTFTDYSGKIGYLAYPPRNGYSDKQKQEIRGLEITGVETIDDKSTPLDDLRHLKYLTRLVLGEGVKGISRNAIPTTVDEIVLSDSVKNIPEGFVSNGCYKSISGPGFFINAEFSQFNNSFFIDEFGRVNFTRSNRLSSGQRDNMEKHGRDVAKECEDAKTYSTTSLIHHSSKGFNTKTLYIYEKSKSGSDASIHAVIDDYPMDESHKSERLSDDKLIGIFVNGVEELDLEDLAKYPDLKTIVIGKSVARVRNVRDDLSSPDIDRHGNKVFGDETITGKKQSVTLLSNETVPLTRMDRPASPSIEDPVVKRGQEAGDDFEI